MRAGCALGLRLAKGFLLEARSEGLESRLNGCGLGEGGARRGNSLPPWAFVVSALLEPRLPVHRTQLSSTK